MEMCLASRQMEHASRKTGSYGEMCRTSRQVDRTSREMARRAILVYDAKDSLSN